ncbi:Hypothetical protein ERS027609_03276 [Mycobacterium tuberculosis]|nr:Hypothetical protein ERS027609_03276 [Mycobacterium tuberculosis]
MHVCHTIADVVDRAKAERSENTLRKDFTPSELLAAGRRIAELERPKAKQRQREGQDHGRQARYSGLGPMGYKPESERHSTKTDTAIGAALGISAGTYRRLKRIDNATRSDDKEIRLFAEKQMAPLAAGSPSWNGRKPSSGNRKAATMAARLDILA